MGVVVLRLFGCLFFVVLVVAVIPVYSLPLSHAVLLWNAAAENAEAIDQQSFLTVLEGMSLTVTKADPRALSAEDFQPDAILVVPQASASLLSATATSAVQAALKDGLTLIFDGRSQFASTLGIKLGNPVKVRRLVNLLRPEIKYNWADAPRTPYVLGALRKDVVYAERQQGYPLLVHKHVGRGQYLYIAPLFDSISGGGYSRFPDLPYIVQKVLNFTPVFSRRGIDAYCDPGYRYDMPVEKLAALWRSWGVRAIHIASWYAYNSPPYDYKALIEAAHKNGILVYAWLEWPFVGKGFWDKHPEWRQKNALLQDAHIWFLYLMDFQNADCFNAVLHDLGELLKLDWDGIDIAEFSITGGVGDVLVGPSRPEVFVGLNDTARAEFSRMHGFDPIELFREKSNYFWSKNAAGLAAFYEYRKQANNKLLERILEYVHQTASKNNGLWETILTVLDNSLHPEFDQLLGYDLKNTIQLVHKYGVTLQVEDPGSEWTKPPQRYVKMGQTYKAMVPDGKFMIDINIVPVHPVTQNGYASRQQIGSELVEQWRAAVTNTERICFYAESTVFPADWEIMPHIMASGTTLTGERKSPVIETPYTVSFTPPITSNNWRLDGKEWPCFGEQGILIPAGKHLLSPLENGSGEKRDFRLLALSDSLIDAKALESGIEVEYRAPGPCALTFSRKPDQVFLDSAPANLRMVENGQTAVIFAPPGRHTLRLLSVARLDHLHSKVD
jgi:hypothetical protein